MVKPRRPLPEQFAWRRWSIGQIRFHKPGDPAPDAIIFELTINNVPVARIMSLENGADQWLVTVHAGLPKDHQRHAIAPTGPTPVLRHDHLLSPVLNEAQHVMLLGLPGELGADLEAHLGDPNWGKAPAEGAGGVVLVNPGIYPE